MKKKRLFLVAVLAVSWAVSLAAQDIPQELKELGFNSYNLVDYSKEGKVEYFTFQDWLAPDYGDTVTYVVEDGAVKYWFKDGVVLYD